MFLFAASRDVQRDHPRKRHGRHEIEGFYSLHRETYSVTIRLWAKKGADHGFYSLHRETYSVTQWLELRVRPLDQVSIRCIASDVSIRCIARRTA